MPPDSSEVRSHFGELAVQYFVAGRAAALGQLLPVLGNLLHHAVEMALKAALAQTHSLAELRKMGHGLPKLWESYKAAMSVGTGRFDSVIAELHRFEDLRYPDSVIERGALIELALLREHVGVPNGTPIVPRYTLVLEDVDELMEHIFHVANMNPQFYTGAMTPAAKELLVRNNLHCSKW